MKSEASVVGGFHLAIMGNFTLVKIHIFNRLFL